MKYDFDKVVSRDSSDSVKWNGLLESFGNDEVIPMWVADMDFRSPEPVIDALRERVDHGIFGYTYKTDEFYDSTISWYHDRHSWNLKREWISYSPGIVTALVMIIRAFAKVGDSIVVQSPVYYPFFDIIKKNGCRISDNQLIIGKGGRYEMDYEDLEKRLSRDNASLFFLSNPHNPVGRVWEESELRRISELCLKHNVLLVADEIHCDFTFEGHPFIPVMELGKEIAMNTISLVAPSKTFNVAGLKSSVIIARNDELRDTYNAMLDIHHVDGMNCFGLHALTAAYKHGAEYVDQLLEYLEGNLLFVRDYIERRISEITLVDPEGTYLLWLDCSSLSMNPSELKDFFVHEAKVALSSGEVFGEGGEQFMRLNMGCPRSVLKDALQRIENAMSKLERKESAK